MNEHMRERARRGLLEAGLLLAVLLVVAQLGPLGTWEIGGFASRFAYWSPLILAGYALFRPVLGFAPQLARALMLPELAVWVGGAALAALPLTLVVHALQGEAWTAEAVLARYPGVATIGLIVSGLFWLTRRRPAAPTGAPLATASTGAHRSATHAAPAMTAPRLLERLPPGRRGQLRALESEDHYVRVHTDLAQALVLVRLRDAIAETQGVPGMQVHRRWWVALDAVEGQEWDGRNVRLRLVGGLCVPVARASIDAARRAGLIR